MMNQQLNRAISGDEKLPAFEGLITPSFAVDELRVKTSLPMKELRFYQSAQEAKSHSPFYTEEYGRGIWVASQPNGQKEALPLPLRSAIHLPTLDRHGQPVAPARREELIQRLIRSGLSKSNAARSSWTLPSGEVLVEPIDIFYSTSVIPREVIESIARRVLVELNQDAAAFESDREVIHLQFDQRILLTGGSGTLGNACTELLSEKKHAVFNLDPIAPKSQRGIYLDGSVLDSEALAESLNHVDTVIHIAGWHGIHAARGQKKEEDFYILNVEGTRKLLKAMSDRGVGKLVYISTTEKEGFYGRSKSQAEALLKAGAKEYGIRLVIVRPPGFVPETATDIYPAFNDWIQFYWRYGVSHQDVASAVEYAVSLMQDRESATVLTVLPKQHFSQEELNNWDRFGPGTTFFKRFPHLFEKAVRLGMDIRKRPNGLRDESGHTFYEGEESPLDALAKTNFSFPSALKPKQILRFFRPGGVRDECSSLLQGSKSVSVQNGNSEFIRLNRTDSGFSLEYVFLRKDNKNLYEKHQIDLEGNYQSGQAFWNWWPTPTDEARFLAQFLRLRELEEVDGARFLEALWMTIPYEISYRGEKSERVKRGVPLRIQVDSSHNKLYCTLSREETHEECSEEFCIEEGPRSYTLRIPTMQVNIVPRYESGVVNEDFQFCGRFDVGLYFILGSEIRCYARTVIEL